MKSLTKLTEDTPSLSQRPGARARPLKQAAQSKQPALFRSKSSSVGHVVAQSSATGDAHGAEQSRRGAAPRTTLSHGISARWSAGAARGAADLWISD